MKLRLHHVESWTVTGSARRCELDEFTSVVQIDLCRLSNHIILSAQWKDGLRDRVCVAAWNCILAKVIGYGVYDDVCIVEC